MVQLWGIGTTVLVCVSMGSAPAQPYDVVVYGGTSGGIAAAVQVARMGKKVVLVEPSSHLGGLTCGGLGATDIGNKAAIGGIAREFYRRIARHYADPAAWKFERPEDYQSGRQRTGGEQEMWTFEPHVATLVYRQMLEEAGVPLVLGERLDLAKRVEKEGARLVAIRTESGQVYRARVFIDATYEGDLLAKAGVSYTVGREANAQYGETLNGVQVGNATKHQFVKAVDPYIVPGDPASGLLPGIEPELPLADGTSDRRVQAYNFRLCATDVPANRRPWPKPADYDPQRHELLLRNFEAGDHRIPWAPTMMPNRKTDANNNFAISTDFIGQNYDYPDADYQTRARIVAQHQSYQQGLMWTLANSPRVPEKIRTYFARWGLAKDEFTQIDNWPHQIYVREARRMVSDYVMTQHNCQWRVIAEDPVGLAAYTMDSHNVQRYVRDGRVWNEGDVQVGGFSPYPISLRSIVPREAECSNLVVPVCLSASHIAYGSIRMEPVFMVLGQSAATAACQAIDAGVPVGRIDYPRLRERLVADGQILEWTGPRRAAPISAASLKGIVIDDEQAAKTGQWSPGTAITPYVEKGYLHDENLQKGSKSVRFGLPISRPGRYEVRIAYTHNPNRAPNVPVTVASSQGERTIVIDQRRPPRLDGLWESLGTYQFEPGKTAAVTVSTAGTHGHVVVDAVQLLPAE